MDDMTLNYHLMHPGDDSLPGDPNAAFFLDGEYHLHYIITHRWGDRKSFSFVHVTSPDMLHWTWRSTKLQPAFTGHGMYSGTGFITREGLPAVIYHGEASGRNQIAIARDRRLSDWHKPYPVDVKNPDGSDPEMKHWDPDCFLVGDTYYAISGGPQPPVFKSKDLKNWTLIGDFLRHDLPDTTIGEDISCPNFFRLGEKWMLLCISHPLGCRYYIGDWDEEAEQFVPQQHGRMNWRRDDQPLFGLFQRTDFFAPESVLTEDGRRVMWSWITSAGTDSPLLNRTVQSLPRELSLAEDDTLRIKPLAELAQQRVMEVSLTDVAIGNPLRKHGYETDFPPNGAPNLQRLVEIDGEAIEIRIVVPRQQALRKLFGFTLFGDGADGGLSIILRPETGTLRVGNTEAPFSVADLPEEEDMELRIFIDKYLVEVFANDRQALLAVHMDCAGRTGLDAFSVGAETTVSRLDVWKIKPTNQGYLDAQGSRVWEPRESNR